MMLSTAVMLCRVGTIRRDFFSPKVPMLKARWMRVTSVSFS